MESAASSSIAPITQTVCGHCGDIFDIKGKYQTHYRHHHQNALNVYKDGTDKTMIERSAEGKFICPCGKEFEISVSGRRLQGAQRTRQGPRGTRGMNRKEIY
jgi:hypothetical protein